MGHELGRAVPRAWVPRPTTGWAGMGQVVLARQHVQPGRVGLVRPEQ